VTIAAKNAEVYFEGTEMTNSNFQLIVSKLIGAPGNRIPYKFKKL